MGRSLRVAADRVLAGCTSAACWKEALAIRLRLRSPLFAAIGLTIAREVPRRGDEVIA
jgi:hypothetical protein